MNRKELVQIISGKLFTLRKSVELSRANMANTIGITVSSYYKNETGLNGPDLTTLHKLADRFKLSLDWLIMGRGEQTYKSADQIREEVTKEIKSTQVTAPETAPESGKDGLRDDVKELMEHMDRIPLLRYEVLTMFHKFKESKKNMVEEAMKPGKEN